MTGYEKLKIRRIKLKAQYGIGAGTLGRYGFKKWLALMERDGKFCKMCKTVDDLTIHHINGKGRYFEEKTGQKMDNSIENLEVLCRVCLGKISGSNPKSIYTPSSGERGVYKRTPEHCIKISLAKIGSKLSEETKQKIRLTRLGKKSSIETRIKASISNSGPRSALWKGGISKLADKIRKSEQSLEWRQSVFKRDDWTCQYCKKRGSYLNVHHKKPFKDVMAENSIKTLLQAKLCKELWDVNNGITLCKNCHHSIHFKTKISS